MVAATNLLDASRKYNQNLASHPAGVHTRYLVAGFGRFLLYIIRGNPKISIVYSSIGYEPLDVDVDVDGVSSVIRSPVIPTASYSRPSYGVLV